MVDEDNTLKSEDGLTTPIDLNRIIDILGHFGCIETKATVVYKCKYDQQNSTTGKIIPCLSLNGATPEGIYNALFLTHYNHTEDIKHNHAEAMVDTNKMGKDEHVTNGWKKYEKMYGRIKGNDSTFDQTKLNEELEKWLKGGQEESGKNLL